MAWPWCKFAIVIVAALAFASAGAARAQDDGPRVYQLVPVGARNFTSFVVDKRGNEGPDPGQTAPGSKIRSDILVARYAHTLSLGGRQFTLFGILPVGRLTVTQGSGRGTVSSGWGDLQFGGTLGLFGAPALTAEDYSFYRPTLSTSLLARVYFPTGAYDLDQTVNLGTNRFSYQLGLPTTFMFGQSFRDPQLTALEALPTVTFYQANHEPFGAHKRTQEALFSVEAHLSHNFSSRVWVSADLLYRDGGKSSTDGVDNKDPVHGWTAGATAASRVIGNTSLALTFEHVVKRWDAGPDGWWFRTALLAPF